MELKNYIEKVIADSCKTENRVDDVDYQYCIIQNTIVFCIKTKYQRLSRRIIYRLSKNTERNFGLKFSLVYPDILEFSNGFGIDVTESECYFDINHTFTRWNVFGNNAYLSTYPANPNYAELLNPNYDIKGQEMMSSHVEEILKIYPDYYGKMTWDEYVDIYKEMYGKDIYVIQETIHRLIVKE